MSKEEKPDMMMNMMDMFFGGMSPVQKKAFITNTMPRLMKRMMEGMTVQDKQELMASMMKGMMSEMSSGEADKRSVMMQIMKSMTGGASGRQKGKSGVEGSSSEDFEPREICPCCDLCEQGFKQKKESR